MFNHTLTRKRAYSSIIDQSSESHKENVVISQLLFENLDALSLLISYRMGMAANYKFVQWRRKSEKKRASTHTHIRTSALITFLKYHQIHVLIIAMDRELDMGMMYILWVRERERKKKDVTVLQRMNAIVDRLAYIFATIFICIFVWLPLLLLLSFDFIVWLTWDYLHWHINIDCKWNFRETQILTHNRTCQAI